jgi:hypothetical protein
MEGFFMKGFRVVLALLIILAAAVPTLAADAKEVEAAFATSLHATSRGMAYWYDKAQGGIETVSGVPYGDLPCKNCHVATCAGCHDAGADKKAEPARANARGQEVCLECHQRQAAVMAADKAAGVEDAHTAAGLSCTDCHPGTDLHGDGKAYDSMKQPGAIAPTCEMKGCHDQMKKLEAHSMHGKKLDCTACHVRQTVSCTNCHMETLSKEGKKVAIRAAGWVFLMNYRGKVASANTQSFVLAGGKTFTIFAPNFPHSVVKQARGCRECHGTATAIAAKKTGKVKLTWLDESGTQQNLKGIVPVVEGVAYEFAYQDYADGKWTPIADPAAPRIQFAGYGTPLTGQQLMQLLQSR